jgi:hypothetical protein
MSSNTPGQLLVISQCGDHRDQATCPASDQGQAANLMHELGHNLGLCHGGSLKTTGACDNEGNQNGKPNYLSVMNYSFSHTGIPGGVTYSRWGRHSLFMLDEDSLSEIDGVLVKDGSVPRGTKTRYWCGEKNRWVTVRVNAGRLELQERDSIGAG